MGFFGLGTIYTPIGLDVGAGSIRMVQLARTSAGLKLAASGVYELPIDLPASGPERSIEVQRGCRKLLEAAPFRGRRVVSCIPNSITRYKSVRFPCMPVRELQQAAAWEGPGLLQLTDQPANIQCIHAGEVRQGEEARAEVILVAVTEADLDEHMRMLLDSGLKPVALDATPTTLARAFSQVFRRQRDAEQVRVVLDVGVSCSKVVILRGRQIMFFKTISIGGGAFNKAVASHLNLSPADASDLRRRLARQRDGAGAAGAGGAGESPLFGGAMSESVQRSVYETVRPLMGELAKEVGLCLRYYSVTFRGSRPGSLHLTGGEGAVPELTQILADQLNMEVQATDPMRGIDTTGQDLLIERRGTLSEWTIATGLALRPVGGVTLEGKAAA